MSFIGQIENYEVGGVCHGLISKNSSYVFFSGNRFCTLETAKTALLKYTGGSAINLVFPKQTHSDLTIEASAGIDYSTQEADAVWTREVCLAVGVVTADCIPLLLWHPGLPFCAAIHAGWRGVASRIIPKTLEKIKPLFDPKELEIWIGPHIKAEDFEVGLDVAGRIAESSDLGESVFSSHEDKQKVRLDLTQVAIAQLREFAISKIHVDPRNTMRDNTLSSFRREKAGCGRMIHMIARIK